MTTRTLRTLMITSVAAAGLALAAPSPANAQISFGVNIGAAPACPYGYYGYAPYNCAPYGYYGPQWFNSGTFIGAGPWFHGHPGFYGPVNRNFDPRYGYHGGFPARGGHFDNHNNFHDFHGNDFHGAYGEGHAEGFHGGGGPHH